jgi:hypothetical protein
MGGMGGVPDPECDWDNTTCQMLRGMFGQLLALMGSTKNVLCTAFLFVYENPQNLDLKGDQWWVLARMGRLFPYTCWDSSNITRNCRKLLVKTCKKHLTNAPCLKMQKMATAAKKVQHVKSQEWLDFLRLVVETVFVCAESMLVAVHCAKSDGTAPSAVKGDTTKLAEELAALKVEFRSLKGQGPSQKPRRQQIRARANEITLVLDKERREQSLHGWRKAAAVAGAATLTPAIAGRLLKHKPSTVSNGTQMMADYLKVLLDFMVQVQDGSADFSAGFTRCVEIALFSYIKHSDSIDGEKQGLRARVHSSETIAEYVTEYTSNGGCSFAPWRSSDNPDHDANMEGILGDLGLGSGDDGGGGEDGAGGGGGDAVAATGSALAIPMLKRQVSLTPAEVLEQQPGSADAIVLINTLPTLNAALLSAGGAGSGGSSQSHPPPAQRVVETMDLAGVPAEMHDACLRKIVEELLMGWRDPPQSEKSALRAAFGTGAGGSAAGAGSGSGVGKKALE